MLGQYKTPFAIVSSGTLTSNDYTYAFTPTSTATGDLVILMSGFTSPTLSGGSGTSWNYHDLLSGGDKIRTAYKFLAAGDVGATFTISGTLNLAPFAWVVYRGPTAMTHKEDTTASSGAALSFTGFTPVNSTALVTGFSHANGDADGIAATGWTVDTINTSFEAKAVLSTTTYFGGSITFTGTDTSVAPLAAALWELT